MTAHIHTLHRAVVVPKAPALMPETMDDLLSRRRDARQAAEFAEFVGLDRHAAIHRAFAARLTQAINARVEA